ncbi:MAG: zinc ABC transporter substrate-binding protein [Marinagarivorans sp.]|nr:zinc ABC transporter substrate-binding protein [Marinagarivorans sp.]
MRILFLLLSLIIVSAPVYSATGKTGNTTSTAAIQHTAIKVVTSFSILDNLVSELGGDHVHIVNLVGRNSDAHMYQPKPSDAVAVAHADLVILNGLGFEGWMTRLLANSRYKNTTLVASQGVTPLMLGDEVDPHAWQSFENIRIYIDNITQSLRSLRPEYATEFSQRHDALSHKITALQKALKERINTIVPAKRVVVTSHDAFGYLGQEWGIQFLAPVGLSTDTEASAADVANLIKDIRQREVKALFIENINNPRVLELIASETGVTVGGRLYSDALSDMDGPASTYVDMMRHNIEAITLALSERGKH